MKTIRSLLIAALAVVVTAAAAAAQTSSSMLNALEVRQLITRAEPGDHARLSAHFAALAERYAADAKRHTAMAQAYAGNRNAGMVAGMRAHCTELAELATKSAATLRELAKHHEELAAGKPSVVPPDAARFEGGAGAPAPTEKELNALAAKASTPADHRALAEYFSTLAKRYAADADEHATMAAAYRGSRIAQSAAHCDRLVTLSRDAAKEANAASTMHSGLAGVAR